MHILNLLNLAIRVARSHASTRRGHDLHATVWANNARTFARCRDSAFGEGDPKRAASWDAMRARAARLARAHEILASDLH